MEGGKATQDGGVRREAAGAEERETAGVESIILSSPFRCSSSTSLFLFCFLSSSILLRSSVVDLSVSSLPFSSLSLVSLLLCFHCHLLPSPLVSLSFVFFSLAASSSYSAVFKLKEQAASVQVVGIGGEPRVAGMKREGKGNE